MWVAIIISIIGFGSYPNSETDPLKETIWNVKRKRISSVKDYRNAITFDLAGTTGLYSIGYKRTIPLSMNNFVDTKIHLSYIPRIGGIKETSRIGVESVYKRKLNRKYVDFGLGIMGYTYHDSTGHSGIFARDDIAYFAIIRYTIRLKSTRNEIGFGFTPLIYDTGGDDFTPWGSINYAYNF